MTGLRRPTIADLAREAGVSRSTASRALTGRGYVAAPVRQRISEAADRLGYVPDAVARSLRHQSSRSIGVLISDLRNPFYAELATAAEQRLRSRGYHMIVANSDGLTEEEEEAARLFSASRVPGAIVAPVSSAASVRLSDLGLAVVEVDRRMGDGDAVLLENEAGALEATRHLLGLGHRRIGVLLGETTWTGAERLAGHQTALAEAGLHVRDEDVKRSTFSPDDAERATRELLDGSPDVTAIFATNNVLAEGAIGEIQRRGLRIPDDLSVVAFDDVHWMSIVQPGITAVAQPIAEIGRRAADLILDRLAGTAPSGSVVVRLPPTLIIRGSTGAPRR